MLTNLVISPEWELLPRVGACSCGGEMGCEAPLALFQSFLYTFIAACCHGFIRPEVLEHLGNVYSKS